MTMMNQLKSGEYARIVEINVEEEIKKSLYLKDIKEGCIIRVISSYNSTIIELNNRIFVVGYKIAKKIRIIHMKNNKSTQTIIS